MRPSWIEIDVDAIEHNVAEIARIVAPAEVCAVVKADGYGHGDIPAAEAALAGGATYLAVALVNEGVRLREAGVEAPILVLSEPDVEAAPAVVRWRLTPTAYRRWFVDAVADAVVATGADPVPIHVKVDTGMFRVGATPDDAVDLARHIVNDERLVLGGVFTHFAVAEEDADFTAVQLGRFVDVLDRLHEAGIQPPLVHAANTAGALGVPESRFNLVRVGLGCYGLYPHPSQETSADLRPAMRVVSHVSMIKTVEAGERPSYGRRRPLAATGTIATVPVGYADGVPRKLSSLGGEVLINGQRFPLAGTVTMDQIVVDCGAADVAVGDEVVLLGSQGEGRIPAEEWATMLGTINYEIVCHFGPRLPRRHLR